MRKKANIHSTFAAEGFTLVEVAVSSVIFVILCVFFLNSAVTSMKSQRLACDYYNAINIARNRLQRARQLEYGSLLLMNEEKLPVDDEGIVVSTGRYFRTTRVGEYTASGTRGLIQVTVQVHYPGATRGIGVVPFEMSTLFSEKLQ